MCDSAYEAEYYTGKLKLVENLNNETLEEQCKRILKEEACYTSLTIPKRRSSWMHLLHNKLNDKYKIYNGKLYKVIEKEKEGSGKGVFYSTVNSDGTISYEVMYFLDYCWLDEAIEYALENKRSAMCELNETEHVILQELYNQGYKYIIRDDCDGLVLHEDKPIMRDWRWISKGKYEYIGVFNHLFKIVKCEDQEPTLIEDLLEG